MVQALLTVGGVESRSRPKTLPRTLRIYLIKPSKYHDDGYVLEFWRGVQPANTLTVLNALFDQWNTVAPDDIPTKVETVMWEEMLYGVVDESYIRRVKAECSSPGVEALICICGVQTNQYPRARDIALLFKAAGFDVIVGGFHISGHEPSRAFLEANGISTVVGEVETNWTEIALDAISGTLQPNYAIDEGIRSKTGKDDIWVPDIEGATPPMLDRKYLSKFINESMTTLDTSRGCPFTCSYCSVKNVMGRTMRSREPEIILDWVRHAVDEHGIRSLFLVDDNFYRNPRWEEILNGFIALRKEGRELGFMMQVDCEASGGMSDAVGSRKTESEKFVKLAAEAGCFEVFIGFETFDPINLNDFSKHQNRVRTFDRRDESEEARNAVVEKYRRAVTNWHNVGISVHSGCMIGFPHDDPTVGKRTAQDLVDIGVDIVSFFIVTPLPGTEDFDNALEAGTIHDWDFNSYETTVPTTHHPKMTPEQLQAAYWDAWKTFYSTSRLAKMLLTGGSSYLHAEARTTVMRQFIWCYYSRLVRIHPMMGGFWRKRTPSTRRDRVTAAVRQLKVQATPTLAPIVRQVKGWEPIEVFSIENLERGARELRGRLEEIVHEVRGWSLMEDRHSVRVLRDGAGELARRLERIVGEVHPWALPEVGAVDIRRSAERILSELREWAAIDDFRELRALEMGTAELARALEGVFGEIRRWASEAPSSLNPLPESA